MKNQTRKLPIEELPVSMLLYVPLTEKFGNKPLPLVKVGDAVKRHQLIGAAAQGYAAKVHSPVSGTVEAISETLQTDGRRALTVVIKNDFKDEEIPFGYEGAVDSNPDELLRLMEDAGIAGEGGAQFPAALKYRLNGKKVDSFIINGAECEPYLSGDYASMSQRAGELLKGIMIVDGILCAGEIVIAFERENKALADVFAPLLRETRYGKIRLKIVPNRYPQGGELQLARTVTGREIPKGALPLDHGVIVSNVGTVLAVYDAVALRKPVVDRMLTVSGEGTLKPGNYRVRIGTPISHIIEVCGIDTARHRIVSGGPMMSNPVTDFSVPVDKGTLGVIAVKEQPLERLNCIWCGYCADACPMRLMPMKYPEAMRLGKFTDLARYNLSDCIECAACEYICPSKVALIPAIKEGKALMKEMDKNGK